jgi:hypothetical protein
MIRPADGDSIRTTIKLTNCLENLNAFTISDMFFAEAEMSILRCSAMPDAAPGHYIKW